MDKCNFSFMQVINITPDSFSDGGKHGSLDKILKRIEEAGKFKTKILDFGAESTAPFNQKISSEEELLRFQKLFFPLVRDYGDQLKDFVISIDTYKISVFKEIYGEIRKHLKDSKIIFNDVSGVIDDGLCGLLQDFDDFDYVYSHTGVGDRDATSGHMQFPVQLENKTISEHVCSYFEDATRKFDEMGVLRRVIFDPCFGFSKGLRENLDLIRDMEKVVSSFSSGQRWLFGISRKSFLKHLVEISSIDSDDMAQREYLHLSILNKWMNDLTKSYIIVRGHDPSIFSSAYRITDGNY